MKDRSALSAPNAASPFVTPLAVDIWDAEFRWREDGHLRDLTIDATWQRVARALAGDSLQLESELLDAMTVWSLLPDPRLIATAGTSTRCEMNEPTASLNLAAFVHASHGAEASLDRTRLAAAVALAVRALDNLRPQPNCLRIGVLGFSDALALLRIDYGSSAARALAREIAQKIWCGAVEASARLVCEGVAPVSRSENWLTRARALGLSESVVDRIRSGGMHHARLTAITSQPALSRLANCVSDALDPPCVRSPTKGCREGRHGKQVVRQPEATTTSSGHCGVAAQLRLRAALQPWMDEPIGYPVATSEIVDASEQDQWRKFANHHGLGELVIEKACLA